MQSKSNCGASPTNVQHQRNACSMRKSLPSVKRYVLDDFVHTRPSMTPTQTTAETLSGVHKGCKKCGKQSSSWSFVYLISKLFLCPRDTVRYRGHIILPRLSIRPFVRALSNQPILILKDYSQPFEILHTQLHHH